ncbi:hypothetical protein PPTG_05930 [Phytophthora nicotianae INRA-310]|uniref:Ankyrin repeat-containing domain n=1 Tax=Phytophthora nicotianae (strain INRA-310) TaxID=761204 RepID=W2QWK2_PHYN3|nr:hypothetical protein PPTG_05930 [Phytophthora nicotianae INRA-310]ETN16829.1 hypothetical protein PPTG_05930 [Phytophthora nicotianae INRA-310]
MRLSRACQLSRVGSLALLELMWARSYRGNSNMARRQQFDHRDEFNQAMRSAAHQADLHMVQWLLGHFPDIPISEMVVRAAAASGRSGMLQLLEGTKTRAAIPWTKQANTELVLAAFEQNNVEELKWALGNGYGVWRSSYCSFYGGDWRYKTEMLRYMLDGGHAEERIARDALVEASEKGDLSFMQWLVSYMEAIHVDVGVDNISLSMENACDRGHLDIVQWLLAYQDNFPSDDDVVVCMEMAMINAARGGALEVVRWLYETYATDSSIDLLAGVSQILMPVYVLDQRWMLQQVTVVFTCSNIFMKPMLRRDESRQLTKHSSSIIKS